MIRTLVHVIDFRDILLVGVIQVVNVSHLGDVHNRVGDIHPLHVMRTTPIVRNVDFSGSQREPSDARATAQSKSASAHKNDQGWRKDWPDGNRPSHPAPAVFGIGPAPVVERRKAPRLIFYPGPAPGIDVRPMAITIRRPIAGNTEGNPDRSEADDI